ncbi:helix-turn-helix domain containing protein [Subtercola sp. PAMC28395]|uniref:helix-turn-helix domain-containing protein n=1 Tax=Subtercola sp. PAMC28395 TaxID=2846775 RepID=UPI001C0E0A61|nr:helix-turn-helix domain-containing protein [Subtercola sp. PAMC28395]QWT23896.1 helix-turn-helix domain containing protein [Subtercola sp. PAMC28395]
MIAQARGEHVDRTPAVAVAERTHFSKLSQPVRTEILARYQQGERVIDLAAAFGISEWSVQNLRKRSGLEPHPRGMSAESIAQAIELFSEGLSFIKIGKRVGFDPKTIAKALRARGIAT